MKKIVLLVVFTVFAFCSFANQIIVENDRFDIEDNILFTNRTGKDVHLDISVKRVSSYDEKETISVIIPANVKNYEIDEDFRQDLNFYEQIIIESIGNISSYDYKIKHDDLNFTIFNYDEPLIFPMYDNKLEFTNNSKGEIAEDYIKLTNKTSKSISYAIYGDSKKASDVFLCAGVIDADSSTDAFSIQSFTEKYGKINVFRFYTDKKLNSVYSGIFSDDLSITIQ